MESLEEKLLEKEIEDFISWMYKSLTFSYKIIDRFVDYIFELYDYFFAYRK